MTVKDDDFKALESRVRRLELALVLFAGLLGSGLIPEALKTVLIK